MTNLSLFAQSPSRSADALAAASERDGLRQIAAKLLRPIGG